MRTKILIAASALLLGMSSAAMAQVFYAGPNYGAVVYGYTAVPYGYYDYAPGYSYGWRGPYYESQRGGPGPRVGSGQGMGVGSQR